MNYLRLLGIVVLFVLVGLGTVGGCGSSGGGGGGEGCCVVGPDACIDGTNQAECDLLEGVLDKGVMCSALAICGIVPPPTNPPPTNPPPTNPPPTNPPSQCQAPPLNTDFSDIGVFFVDAINAVLIGLTSDGENVALTLSDIPDSGAVIGLGATAQGENLCDIFTALVLDIFVDASGECVRLDNGEMLEVNDLVVFDIPAPSDLSGDCEDIVPLDTADLNEVRHMVIEKMEANGRVRSLDKGQTNILDFVEDIPVSSE